MAETLSRKLGRPVTVSELGFVTTPEQVSGTYPRFVEQAIETSEQVWARLAKQISCGNSEGFHIGMALQAALAWRYDRADDSVAHTGRQPVTSADVQSLYTLTELLADLDRRHGGGSTHTRTMIGEILVRQVKPMLRGTYTDDIGRGLMRATATLSGQLAFMSYDAGQHGIAQRHFTLALRLAKAADDRLYGAHLLANLATQAVYLGYAQDATRLAEAAIDGAGRAPASISARLYTALASAYSRLGDKRACQTALGRAERAIDRASPGEGPRWVGYFSPAHFAGTAMRCLSDLRLYRQALRHAPAAITLDQHNTRTRALHTALIAMTHAHAGDVDGACTWGSTLAAQTLTVQSVRVAHRIRELTAALDPYQAVPQVADLLRGLPRAQRG
ncbi:hypothetical protein D0Q02_06400 [Micromonospora craniellae]|uniref:Transcriptional regulator n=2 Tax=Micromonospora craniellae TaxID=2294034 RepID=A0A372G2A1_9ACTN|nr:hypothetical protein D0Q02_06400 [Micromonospora craniellae]